MSNFIIFKLYLIYFEILCQLPVFYPQKDPLVAHRALKINYILILNNIITKRLILDFKVSLEKSFIIF